MKKIIKLAAIALAALRSAAQPAPRETAHSPI
jgi:hypothetical protein